MGLSRVTIGFAVGDDEFRVCVAHVSFTYVGL